MSKPDYISKYGLRQSLSARISLWVVLFATAIFVASLGYLFLVSRNAVKREAIRGATRVLDNTVLRVNGILEDVELAANNLEWLIYKDLDKPDMMMEYSRNVVLNNSFINGCSISFEPYFYKSKGKYYSCYSNNNGHQVFTRQEGNDQYQYFYLDWYLLPKLLGQPCWTEPYTDQEEEDDGIMDSKMMVSYCKPLIGNDGAFVGTLTLDISLEWLSETISAVKPYPNSYSILIGRGGTYLVHPDPEMLFYQSIFTPELVEPNPELRSLGDAMQDWQEGMRELNIDGERCFVYFKPMMTTGWSVAIVCPAHDVFGGFRRLQNTVLLIVILGLFLMFVLFSNIIRQQLLPLQTLAAQAKVIAGGDLNHTLPQSKRKDEIGVLNNSFGEMQSSLVAYIKELTAATAKKERIEGELQIARGIQMGMVPSTFPPFPDRKDIDLYASMTPAKEVGGDLYDFFLIGNKLHFCIGDVSGKGVPASLFMAVACNLFRILSKQGLPPAEVARQINDRMSEKNEQLMFVTMFIGQLDLTTGRLDFCNCGHNPPIVLTPKPHFMDCLPNTPIGVCEGWEFKDQIVENVLGTPILLYTDGLNEAENLVHVEFGNDKLLASLSEHKFVDARELIEALQAAVAAHVGQAEPSDDLTMLCINTIKL